MKKHKGAILVTGGAGFIGSNVCERLLKDGFFVICLDNFDKFYSPKHKENNIKDLRNHKNFKLVRGSILNKSVLNNVFSKNKITKIIHLAALPSVRKSIENPHLDIEVDIKGTVNLLQLAVEYKASQFIFASSSSIYGRDSKKPFVETEAKLIPISPYGASKLSAEIFCHTYNKLFGLPVVILRFFNVYGPKQRPDLALPKFVALAKAGKEIPQYGDGTTARDYTYIDDIVEGIVVSMKKKFDFEVFNLGNSSPVKLKDFIGTISKQMDKKFKIKQLSTQLGDPDITFANNKKAKKLLGWSPTISLEKGIEKYLKSIT